MSKKKIDNKIKNLSRDLRDLEDHMDFVTHQLKKVKAEAKKETKVKKKKKITKAPKTKKNEKDSLKKLVCFLAKRQFMNILHSFLSINIFIFTIS